MSFRGRALWAWFAPACFALGASCSVPDFEFYGTDAGADSGMDAGSEAEPLPEQCENRTLDVGETDTDCGGTCGPCGLGKGCASDGDCAAGQCVDFTCQDPSCMDLDLSPGETDVDCGGGTCQPCPPGKICERPRDCDSAVCSDGTCQDPSCTDKIFNGDESDVDCGGEECDRCLPPKLCREPSDCASEQCEGGKCTISCVAGTGNCDGDMANGCEANLLTDALHCSGCGMPCNLPHAVAACSGGSCRVTSCQAPYADCDGDPENGCEVNTSSDAAHCAACGTTCPPLNGTPFCAASECGIQCADGFGDCDGNAANGCERDLTKDVLHCGQCGTVCPAVGGATPYCDDSQCGVSNCPVGFGNCNGDPDDGCEAHLTNDAANCGRCGGICDPANADGACQASACVIAECATGFADCNGGYDNGCETNIQRDTANCGGCNSACNISNATPRCESGQCRVLTCNLPFADCNQDGLSCETNTSNNEDNCGGCGTSGLDCDAIWNPKHADGICQLSACVFAGCQGSFRDCNANTTADGCEADINASDNHCGGCGDACLEPNGRANSCTSGSCVPSCTARYLNCDGDGWTGCEVDSDSSDGNCGACGVVCQESNVVGQNTCSGGVCGFSACASNYLSCNANTADGCEINRTSSKAHCGACNNACEDFHTTSNNCGGAGLCMPMCQSGWGSCDGDPDNGCETQVNGGDEVNCGQCGRACELDHASSSTCNTGTCAPVCNTGWKACSSPHLGCTTELGTISNCADCGNVCSGATPYCVGNPGSATCQAQPPTVGFSAQYQVEIAANTSSSIGSQLIMKNSGPDAVPLNELTIRYYFTNEVSASLTNAINWGFVRPNGGGGQTGVSVSVSIQSLVPATPTANAYVQFSFPSGSLPSNHHVIFSWVVQNAMSQNFTQSNDYSFNATMTSAMDWTKVVIRRGTMVIWGTAP